MSPTFKILKKNYLLFSLFLIFKSYSLSVSAVQVDGIAQQADGKLVTANNATVLGTNQILLTARYNTDGSLDSTFGAENNGTVLTSVGLYASLTDIGIQSTGNIIVGGYADFGSSIEFLVIAYDSNGDLDTTFGVPGTGIVSQLVGDASVAYALAIQPADNKVVQAGIAVVSGVSNFALVRYTAAGLLDTTFDTDGMVTTDFGTGGASAQALVMQPSDNKIIAAGWALLSGNQQIALARYNTDGSLDTSFGTGGLVNQVFGTTSIGYSVALDASENILVGGTSDNAFIVARFLPDGTLDTTFGTGGSVITPIGDIDQIRQVLVQSTGEIIAIGSSDENIAIARYTSGGVLDTTFGTNGIVQNNIQDITQAYTGLIQADGQIVAAGSISTNALIERFNTDGTFDNTWGLEGIVTVPGGNYKILATYIRDQKAQGTNGGTFTSGAWQTRDLNLIIPASANISLLNNQIILQPGIYEVEACASAYAVDSHKIRLQNITDSITLAFGSSAFSNSTNPSLTTSVLRTKIFVNIPTTLELQHQCQTTKTTDGFGLATNFGSEVYTIVKVVQES